jgi:hypothetical protein
MTSSSRPTSRPSRRAVRQAGTVGTDDSILVSSHPAVPVADVPDPTRADANQPDANQPDANQPDANQPDANQPDAAGVREPAIPVRSADDTDVGWGEASDANDDRLRRDKPPHW